MIGQPPSFISESGAASITVEAALALPIFFFAVLTFVFILKIISCQEEVYWALTRTAKEAAVEKALQQENDDLQTAGSLIYLTTKLNYYVKNSNVNIHLTNSKIMVEDNQIDLIADYNIPLPVRIFTLKSVPVKQRVRTRAFVGVESRGAGDSSAEEVYITETGRVYHRKETCSYLKLSISEVQYQDLTGLRNESGGKYKPCHSCCREKRFRSKDIIYIANYGDRFHSERTCSRIIRTIKKIKLSEAGNRLPCSKCGK